MYAQCALRHTISPVLHKLCKLVPVSRPFSQWGVWVDAITWYCHILTAEPHFNSETENTHTEYLNTSSTAIYLQKMANELRSIRTYVVIRVPRNLVVSGRLAAVSRPCELFQDYRWNNDLQNSKIGET